MKFGEINRKENFNPTGKIKNLFIPDDSKPTGEGSCLYVEGAIINIWLDADSLKVVSSGLFDTKYCVDAKVSGGIGWHKECAPLTEDDLREAVALLNNSFYIITGPNILIYSTKGKICGPCELGINCNCSESVDFPSFTANICSQHCNDGWADAIKKDLASPLNNALKKLKVGGCSCVECAACKLYDGLPTTRKGELDIENMIQQIVKSGMGGLMGAVKWRKFYRAIKEFYDKEPTFCP